MYSTFRAAQRCALVADASSRAVWAPKILALEDMCIYPLGTDAFKLDHGKDYFAFFDRMGASTHVVLPDAHNDVLGQVFSVLIECFCIF